MKEAVPCTLADLVHEVLSGGRQQGAGDPGQPPNELMQQLWPHAVCALSALLRNGLQDAGDQGAALQDFEQLLQRTASVRELSAFFAAAWCRISTFTAGGLRSAARSSRTSHRTLRLPRWYSSCIAPAIRQAHRPSQQAGTLIGSASRGTSEPRLKQDHLASLLHVLLQLHAVSFSSSSCSDQPVPFARLQLLYLFQKGLDGRLALRGLDWLVIVAAALAPVIG